MTTFWLTHLVCNSTMELTHQHTHQHTHSHTNTTPYPSPPDHSLSISQLHIIIVIHSKLEKLSIYYIYLQRYFGKICCGYYITKSLLSYASHSEAWYSFLHYFLNTTIFLLHAIYRYLIVQVTNIYVYITGNNKCLPISTF